MMESESSLKIQPGESAEKLVTFLSKTNSVSDVASGPPNWKEPSFFVFLLTGDDRNFPVLQEDYSQTAFEK